MHIPAGWCRIGGDPRAPDGLARRRVWIDGFVLQRTPVTQRQYLAFLRDLIAQGREAEARRHTPQDMLTGADRQPLFTPGPDGQLAGLPDQADHPVVLVDHGAVRAYAAWLSARTGHRWGLPHELAWEKAARGADGRLFPWGDRFEATWACTLHTAPGPPTHASVEAFPTDEPLRRTRPRRQRARLVRQRLPDRGPGGRGRHRSGGGRREPVPEDGLPGRHRGGSMLKACPTSRAVRRAMAAARGCATRRWAFGWRGGCDPGCDDPLISQWIQDLRPGQPRIL
ncbi:MAG: SUMF1/EgtB/PvdO family nonheme iron enzyme [bacterium]